MLKQAICNLQKKRLSKLYLWFAEEEEDEAAEAGGAKDNKAKGGSSLLGSFVRNITTSVVGTAALTRDDIAPALQGLKKKLMERNVAEGIAEK